MLNAKLKGRVRNIVSRERTMATDIVQYVTNAEWKWARHITQIEDNRWITRSTEWHIKGVTTVGKQKPPWRDVMWGNRTRIAKDRERWRTGGGLLPAVDGHSLEQNRAKHKCTSITIKHAQSKLYATSTYARKTCCRHFVFHNPATFCILLFTYLFVSVELHVIITKLFGHTVGSRASVHSRIFLTGGWLVVQTLKPFRQLAKHCFMACLPCTPTLQCCMIRSLQ